MMIIRGWIVVSMFGLAGLFLGFGCATRSENSVADGQTAVITTNAHSAQLATNAPTPPATPAVYVPDTTHANAPLPAGVLTWDSVTKTTDATNEQEFARFTFSFTNIATTIETGLMTNIAFVTNTTAVTNSSFWGKKIRHLTQVVQSTNLVAFTNSVPAPVTILSVHPSCGCTTAQLPPMPWVIAPGTNGQIGITVNLAGKSGTLFKTVNVGTDKGNLNLMVRITILPPVLPTMTDADRIRAMASAKVDRQAVFKGDCAACHVKPGVGKYGKALYDVSCGICHESEHRASMVPDLHSIKTATNEDFWRTWIMHGKPGSLMPAFATAEGGPLNDIQISSLASYLNAAIPSKAPAPPQ